jgi:RNA polymerase sigma factor (sigma-70 family)
MAPDESNTRREWVLAALDSYEGRLLRYAQRFVDENLARDVVQHAFLQLCRQPPHSLNGQLSSWLYAVCRNRAIDLKRRTCRLEPLACGGDQETAGREVDPAESFETHDAGELVRKAIGTLPQRQQEVVNLWSEGFCYREISEITGATENYVRVMVHRAFQSLREHPLLRRLIAEEADVT